MATPFIRPFNTATDQDAGLHVFYTTADASVSHEPARTISSYLYYCAYTHLSPSTCLVLDDGAGLAVGYIIGTPDTAAFSSHWKSSFAPTLEAKLIPPPHLSTEDPALETPLVKGLRKSVYEGACSMLQGVGDREVLREYPAHLHINILPEFTGKGWGGKMVGAWLEVVKELGAQGVHLGMVRTNEGARRFYERLGFRLCEEVLDGGASGKVGRQDGAVCLVKRL
ncbi:GCN5-related N-acetyltransferas-like protein [Bimuria novae-zelandiae CBS 107.79]|uniref:GCN5-related N-acetyltransferas-like protein n=1 Tax=Bimuria novae-zelandiae CBS 107.79 TaxID=1447943 RepID=A0A6A5VQC0_9PLEO|nr:GCN5-related N-acetyltransferas-like protein [Bimuria novae-zelandiae CBS 107.79]